MTTLLTEFEGMYEEVLEEVHPYDDYLPENLSNTDRAKVEICLHDALMDAALTWAWDNGDFHSTIGECLTEELKVNGPEGIVNHVLENKREPEDHEGRMSEAVDRMIDRLGTIMLDNDVDRLAHELELCDASFCDEDYELILTKAEVPQFYAENNLL